MKSDSDTNTTRTPALAGVASAAALAPDFKLGAATKELTASLSHISKIGEQMVAARPFAAWAEEHRRNMAAFQEAFAGSVGKAAREATASLAKSNDLRLGVAALAARKAAIGQLSFTAPDVGVSAAVAKSLAGITTPVYTDALRKALFEPSQRYRELFRSWAPALEAHRALAISPSVAELLGKQRFTFPEVIDVGQKAADLLEEEGDEEEAGAVREIVAEVSEVTATPSSTALERLALTLSAKLDEVSERLGALDDLSERVDENEQRRQSDHKDATLLAFYFCYLGLVLEAVRLLIGLAAGAR